MLRLAAAAAALAAAIGLVPAGRPAAAPGPPQASFATLVERLSEPGGYFGGDNLVSNEQSFQRVLPAMDAARVESGAYVGVGPDQNFTYIAAVRPAVAFLVDIRRDNLLLHLFFKALFELSPTRAEYLCLLTGRAPPDRPAAWADAPVARLVAHVDGAPPLPAARLASRRASIEAALVRTGVPLAPGDLETIARFHRAFIEAGLSLMFRAHGQAPRSEYPSLRDLLLEHDGTGRRRHFLADEGAYQAVRRLQARDLVVPVVGDVSGPRAMRAIASEIRARGLALSAMYISNVEYYLFADGRFDAFVENLRRLPADERSTMIRSVFPSGYRGPLPQWAPDHYSASLTQPVRAMLVDHAAGRYARYADLILASAR